MMPGDSPGTGWSAADEPHWPDFTAILRRIEDESGQHG